MGDVQMSPPAMSYAELVARLRKKRMRVHDLSGVNWEDDDDCHAAATALETVERERDEAREEVASLSAIVKTGIDEVAGDGLDELEARVESAEAQVAKLKEALSDAAKELSEAADKFNVIHHNHPGSGADNRLSNRQAEDKAFCAELSDRMLNASRRAREALKDTSP